MVSPCVGMLAEKPEDGVHACLVAFQEEMMLARKNAQAGIWHRIDQRFDRLKRRSRIIPAVDGEDANSR